MPHPFLSTAHLLRAACWLSMALAVCLLAAHAADLPPPANRATTAATAATRGAMTDGLPGFEHTGWRVGRGAPGDIWDIRQDALGYLWLATGSGLYRFDGRTFERQTPRDGQAFPSSNMTTLHLDPDGDLWIGYYSAGISRLSHGKLTHYPAPTAVPSGLIPRIARDGDGRLWAAIDGGLRWFDNGLWRAPDPAWRLPERHATSLLLDARGRFWVLANDAVYVRDKGASRFTHVSLDWPVTRFSTLGCSATGDVWLSERRRGLVQIADAAGPLDAARRAVSAHPDLRADRLHFASDGSLWGSRTAKGGVFRMVPSRHGDAPSVESFDVRQGLTSDSAVPVFEDREGSVWVGTNLGLDRFRQRSVLPLPLPAGHDRVQQLFRSADGRVVAYDDHFRALLLDRHNAARLQRGQTPDPVPDDLPVWMDANARIVRLQRGVIIDIPSPGARGPGDVYASAFDGRDRAWLCAGSTGSFTYAQGQWRRMQQLPAQPCSTVTVAGDGAVWLGYADGTLRVLDGDRVRRLGTAEGLRVGPLTALHGTDDMILAAGENGLAVRVADGVFRTIRPALPGVMESISGIARDASGEYWLNGSRGLVRVAATALREAALQDSTLAAMRLFDAEDGMPGIALQAQSVSTATIGADGLLWLSTNQGLASVDTRRLRPNRQPPPVVIGAISHGQHQQPLTSGLVLPRHTTQIQIDYTALSLARPERVRYRHRLVGLDDQWQDVGTLTRAFYTNLPPGDYQFEVMAANEDGVWGGNAARRAFRIAPAFVQTWAFRVLCVVLGLLGLALLVRLRSRQLAAVVRARLQERHAERERIARELHDTLLQGTQGMILRLHATSQRADVTPALRDELERAMQLAEDAAAQGRDRVRALRGGGDAERDLGKALLQIYNELGTPPSTTLRLLVEGSPRALRADATEELYLIGREALLNALQHAQATAIEIELVYDHHELRLHIRDDGQGLPADAAERRGHFGIRGMRERAARIGARIRLWSRPGAGTEVELGLPRARAYLDASAPRPAWRRWLTRLSGDPA